MFEKLEVFRWFGYFKKEGILIYFDYEIFFVSVIIGVYEYFDVEGIL